MNEIMLRQYTDAVSTNLLYQRNQDVWEFLLYSYMGGEEYKRAAYLTRYVNETDGEYAGRLNATFVENHSKSVISTYISFLFREQPKRDLGSLEYDPVVQAFLEDADLDGRSFDNFIKEVSVWSSVFGHCWCIMAKPNVGAQTLGEEMALGVRPYLNLLTPLTVMDWQWSRDAMGRYELVYFKYTEEANDTFTTIKEWTKETITTSTVNHQNRTVNSEVIEPNQLGRIPAILAYNHRSPVRGIGISDLSDIASAQKYIYNLTSEVEQSIRINGHPALVKTVGTEAAAGAGAIVTMEDNLDPGLRPFMLSVSTDTNSIYQAITHTVDAIDKMANVGSVRSSTPTVMSGVAREQEFALLNAKLSEKADNLELTEEHIWELFCLYQGRTWDGKIEYPGSFNIRDTDAEVDRLVKAKQAATDPVVLRKIDEHILDSMDEEYDALPFIDPNPQVGRTYEDGEEINSNLPAAYQPATNPEVPEGQNCGNCEYYKPGELYCTKFDAPVRAVYWCAKWEPTEENELSIMTPEIMAQIQEMIMTGMTNAEIIDAIPGITVEDIVTAAAEAARNNN